MLKHTLSPIKLGTMELQNRFVVTAMASLLCEKDGKVTPEYIAIMRQKQREAGDLLSQKTITQNHVEKAFRR